jgi:hypothetical protein
MKGQNIYVLYKDYYILMGPNPEELDNMKMKDAKLDLTVEGDISDSLGVKISYHEGETTHKNQPHLIDSILKELHLDQRNSKCKNIPAAGSKLLSEHTASVAFEEHFNYQLVIGKLNYMKTSTRPDNAYAVHQCTRFVSNPKVEHGNGVKWLGRYLQGTKDKGIILKPKGSSFDIYVDADFAGNWNKDEATKDDSTARSGYGYFIRYMGCPNLWASKLKD